ncbi:hypothetical protein [Aliikangiella sp. G2MR2-5]|uniref:hypothetical protein n=1 Tax=Aliikangiella sp. G2MR2-5 TaxID=2788943 RepID=UPI0018AAE8FB|nr:hypothetical protein [Aliikangiella sp. G2MR2-5]
MKKYIGMLFKLLCIVNLLLSFTARAASTPTPTQTSTPVATFTLQDKTGLGKNHKIYVLGFSSNPGYYLNSDGTWLPLTQQANGQIPCFELGTDKGQINKVKIDSSQTTLSARVYFFADDQGTYGTCNNGTTSAGTGTTQKNGIFGTNNFSYTWTSPSTFGVVGITQASIGAPGTGIPLYSFSEIGPGPSNGTIDVSQVDLYSFPVTIEASVLTGNPGVIGNSYNATTPTKTVSFSDNSSYTTFINGLAGTGGCKNNPTSVACPYLDLAVPYGNYSILLNPGGFLNSNTSAAQNSKLQKAFDTILAELWKDKAPSITLANGGIQGSAPQDTFVGTSVSMIYPCNKTGVGCPTVRAIKFVGKTSKYVAYMFSPIDYASGCAAGTITGCPAGSIASSGNQVFSGAGVFGTTATTEYNNMVRIQGRKANLLPKDTTQYGVGSYASQVARLGLIMTQALNHGAFSQCKGTNKKWKGYDWTCLNLQTNWYPTQASGVTQNLYSQFMHTAANTKNIPLFVQPPNAATSAGGTLMGMAYGFSNDEKPTPQVPNTADPEVPSKMDGTVIYNGAGPYTITLGPWK